LFELTGKVALVTRAGRGIGAGIARTLAAQGTAVLVNTGWVTGQVLAVSGGYAAF
jgi:NAD(P)-dependent dehydrogenase (short-subunit alcohol dehydrogenase family)